MTDEVNSSISAWFAGPKAENGERFGNLLRQVYEDYQYWRRNYFPEDGHVVDSKLRREQEDFDDRFEDLLFELMAKLKEDFPFHSPRYAAHMVSEQSLPSIAGYFAAMLYNPNNVAADAAPVTVRLELEAMDMITTMLGYGQDSWAHLTGGGTLANVEALWVARSVKYLPFLIQEVSEKLNLKVDLPSRDKFLGMPPQESLALLGCCFDQARARGSEDYKALWAACRGSEYNVSQTGLAAICQSLDSSPVLVVPETHHYSLAKLVDVLGIGQKSLVRVKVDKHLRMDVSDLSKKLDEIEQNSQHVLAVVPVMGTTEEGSIDPLNQILDLRAERESKGLSSFWIHADAAYGGYFRTVTVPERIGLGKPTTEVSIKGKTITLDLDLPVNNTCDALECLGQCDSITVDPHKLGYIPYPAGAVCFKSNLVKPILRQDAPYIADDTEHASFGGIGEYILEGSKPGAAAAAVWLSHKLIPLDSSGHGRLIRDTIRNACELHSLLERWPDLAGEQKVQAVCVSAPGSNVVCYAFRPIGKNMSLKELNECNRALHKLFSISPGQGSRVYNQKFFVSKTEFSADRYALETVEDFITRLGVQKEEYLKEGVFLFRSVLMNPWYELAKRKDRYYLVELTQELYSQAEKIFF